MLVVTELHLSTRRNAFGEKRIRGKGTKSRGLSTASERGLKLSLAGESREILSL